MLSRPPVQMELHLAEDLEGLPLEALRSKVWASVSELTTVAFLLVESVEKLCNATRRKV